MKAAATPVTPTPVTPSTVTPSTVTPTRVAPTRVAPTRAATSAPAGSLPADVALLAAALAAGVGATRLVRAPATVHVLLPVAACIVTGHVVVAVVRRSRLPDPVPSILGLVAVALAAVWTLIPRATRDGLPTATSVRVLLQRFSDAGSVIRSHPTPVPSTTGVVLCLAAGAGLAAVFARTLWAWQELRSPGARRPLVALVPTFGLFCYTALLSSDRDRLVGTVSYLATALVFLTTADRAGLVRRRRALWSGTAAALAMAMVAVGIPAAASPGLNGLHLDAIPFSQGGPIGVGGSGSTGGSSVPGTGVLSLIDNMRSVLTARSDLIMFTASSRIPTYWQIASLTRFDGTSWLPDGATRAAASGVPQLAPQALPDLPVPVPGRTFTVHVSVGDLRSSLLPVPPATITVGEATALQIEAGIGVVQPFPDTGALTYSAVASVPSSPAKTAEPSVDALDASVDSGSLGPYLALPRSIPPSVVALAHQIVAHAKTPFDQANALVRFFTTDKRFRYTLTPPEVRSGNALSSFLFTTRAGFCQQFAGAFAVLARIDGLPTRVAIGFTTGTNQERNSYIVTGADAHSWPEVYLGPLAGWVSFEPTPASTDEALGAGIQNGVPTTTPSHPTAVPTTSLPVHTGKLNLPDGGALGLVTNARPNQNPRPHPSWTPIVVLALAAMLAIVVAAVVGPWLWRRRRPRLRRRRFARSSTPRSEILTRWEDAAAVLARSGLARRPAETLEEHTARLVTAPASPPTVAARAVPPSRPQSPATDSPAVGALEAYSRLAALAARASYAPDPCTEADVVAARQLSAALRSALRRRTPAGAGQGAGRP